MAALTISIAALTPRLIEAGAHPVAKPKTKTA